MRTRQSINEDTEKNEGAEQERGRGGKQDENEICYFRMPMFCLRVTLN